MEKQLQTKFIKDSQKEDPRLYRALIAKLNDSRLLMHEALIIGGFDFPKVTDNYRSSTFLIRDSDGVLLGQRKNQLSKKLKEAKNQIETRKNKTSRSDASSTACSPLTMNQDKVILNKDKNYSITPTDSKNRKLSPQRISSKCVDSCISVIRKQYELRCMKNPCSKLVSTHSDSLKTILVFNLNHHVSTNQSQNSKRTQDHKLKEINDTSIPGHHNYIENNMIKANKS